MQLPTWSSEKSSNPALCFNKDDFKIVLLESPRYIERIQKIKYSIIFLSFVEPSQKLISLRVKTYFFFFARLKFKII